MLADVVRYLRCPVCAQPLTLGPQALACPGGHSFDVARQGYVQLAAGPLGHAGDTADMVGARADFLARGHYDFLSRALAGAAADATPDFVVDVGAGTGRHLAAVLDARPAAVGLALDVSKPALRQAARAHPRAGAVRCDVWQALPLADARADLVLDVFAPRNGTQFARVLRPAGTLLVATPTGDHLHELVGALRLLRVDPDKEERVAASLAPWFRQYGQEVLVRTLTLRRAEVATLVGMGPSAWHADPARLAAAVARLPEPVRVTASVRLARYRRTEPPC
ncbi:MAG: rRNA (guanine745-N1)-methyltransferase [Micromonosporaceae bacterium]